MDKDFLLTSIKKLKLISLNTNLHFEYLIDQVEKGKILLIINFSSPNVYKLASSIKHFISNYSNLYNLSNFSRNILLSLLIPHKIKYYEEYLSYNIPFPIYQITEIFSLKIDSQSVITNKNNSLEILSDKMLSNISYIIISKENITIVPENSINTENKTFNEEIIKNINQTSDHYYLFESNLTKDISLVNLTKPLIITLNNKISNQSDLKIYNIIKTKSDILKPIHYITFNKNIKSFHIYHIDHNNFILTTLDFFNKIEAYNCSFIYKLDKSIGIEINDKIEIEDEDLIEKTQSLDLKKVRLTKDNLITWDHNIILIFQHNLFKFLKKSDQNITKKIKFKFYNLSGQKTKNPPKPLDGTWKQTIWGNINNIFASDNLLYIADREYFYLRTLNLENGRSNSFNLSSLNIKNELFPKVKGKVGSLFVNNHTIHIVDLESKKIKKINLIEENKNEIDDLLYDEDINLLSDVIFLDSLKILLYTTSKGIKTFDVLMKEYKLI